MLDWLKNWFHEHNERERYYHRMARFPMRIVGFISFGVAYLTDKLNIFPNFFKAMAITAVLLCGLWCLFIYVGAKHRSDDWDKF